MQVTTANDTVSQLAGKPLDLLAPLSGPVLALETVPDPVFAQKIIGPGIAIDPTSTTLLAPCAGKIVQLHRARHAIAIEPFPGRQVLLHIGLDTVKLKGQGFEPLVNLGDHVSAGQKLIEFDADLIAREAKSLITVMVLTDVTEDQVRLELPVAPLTTVEAGRETILRVLSPDRRDDASIATEPGSWEESPELAIENLPTGLHARPAALLAALAKKFQSQIQIIKNPRRSGPAGNGKSVVSIMALEIVQGDRVVILAEGPDASAAAKEVFEFLRDLRETKSEASTPPLQTVAKTSSDPNLLIGVGVSPGLAVGRIHRVRRESLQFDEVSRLSPEKEESLLNEARRRAAGDLKKLMAEVRDKSEAAIFSAHQELLEDPDLAAAAESLLRQGKSASFAWITAVNQNAERLARLSNELMANRANDLRDVGQRVLGLLVGKNDSASATLDENSILIAENLTPSETVQLDRRKVLGFCTTGGGATSHVAILARSLGLPAIAAISPRALELADGTEVVLDGERGELRLSPSADEKNRAEREQKAQWEKRQQALKLSHQPAQTADGRPIEVAANIGSATDARQAVEMGADGVGLLRSEFLFLERDSAPSEDEQYQVYQEIADVLGSRPLVIRTLDVGGDKPLKYLPLEPEENPFLGIRGVRIGLRHPEILREQLRAILRVKGPGKLRVMFPMIATIDEFRAAKALLEEERDKLGSRARTDLEVGIMVEVPSVALAAEAFAREADFFSVGTNDLTQYTLAMDRGHKALAKQVDALHPSVLKLIQLAAEAAHRHGKWIGVCGGLASDMKAVSVLVGLGIDELSVSVPSIPLVKSAVRETTTPQARELADSCVRAEAAPAVRHLISSKRNANGVVE